MSQKQYVFIKDSGGTLPADKIIAEIGDQATPILWLGEGRFCLIPQAVVQNLLDLHDSLQQANDSEYKTPPLQISWNQGVEVSSDIGRILAGE